MNLQPEIETLIRARYPILYVISSEETRVQNMVVEIARQRQKKVFEWSYSIGIVPAGTSIQSQKHRNAATKDPLAALDQVIEQVEPAIFVFKDFHPFLTKNNFAVIRKLKDIALHLKNSFKTIILVSPVLEIPTELEDRRLDLLDESAVASTTEPDGDQLKTVLSPKPRARAPSRNSMRQSPPSHFSAVQSWLHGTSATSRVAASPWSIHGWRRPGEVGRGAGAFARVSASGLRQPNWRRVARLPHAALPQPSCE